MSSHAQTAYSVDKLPTLGELDIDCGQWGPMRQSERSCLVRTWCKAAKVL